MWTIEKTVTNRGNICIIGSISSTRLYAGKDATVAIQSTQAHVKIFDQPSES